MLFVNEELEEPQPIFSEPKRVRPKTDDEMARRIKCMLGDYVGEDDYPADDSTEPINLPAENATEPLSHDENSKLSQQNSFDDKEDFVFQEKQEKISNGSEIIEEEKNLDESVLLITNETKESSTDHNSAIEEASVNSRRCSLKRQCKDKISLLDYNPLLTIRTLKRPRLSSSSKGKTFEYSDIPTLKKYPDVQIIDCLSEVPEQEPPPLLDSSAPKCTYTGSTEQNDKSEDLIFKVKDGHKKSSKKKKKKKVIYESLPISEETTLSSRAQESKYGSIDSEDGPCQIKNGVIKIRLSKLIDTKNDASKSDYGLSFCETSILPPLKKLSVPLSPLTSDIYSAYNSTRGKNHTSKRALKKMKKRESNSLTNNKLNNPDNSCQKMISENDINEDFGCNSEKVDVSKTTSEENVGTEFIDVSKEDRLVQIAEDSTSTKQLVNDLPILQKSTLENEPVLLVSSNDSNTNNSKIMCSINLSLINRLPKQHDSPNDQIHSDNEVAKDDVLKDSLDNSLAVNLTDSQVSFGLNNENSCLIKKEKFTPTTSYLNNNETHSLENKTSHGISQENFSQEDSCPNLTPAYSFEMEDKCNILSGENGTKPEESLICKATPSLTSEPQKVDSTKTSALFPYPQFNKIKIEVPDAILSNHERWNEYKEYKWCRDFTDVSYHNGSAIFKDQIAYNVHGLWQDPELKKQYSSEYYLNEAKKLKHQADKEIDRMVQAMKYLEAVLYFILTGNAMEHSYIDTDRVHTMYKETLALIRFISSKFQKLHNASCRNIDNKLTVLSLRCQSLLYLKMYQLRRDEVRYLHRNITTFLKSETAFPGEVSPLHSQTSKHNLKPQVSPSQQASPCSFTPSPAGSVASVSSQSSGYSSSELGWSSTNLPNNSKSQSQYDISPDSLTVSRSKYKMLQQQSAYLSNLHLCHDLWEHADYLSSKEHSREFFLELDEECGCLSLHSPFSALVHYVRKGLYKLKDGT
ncbi:hypothetical protein JTE90_010374 [Oedothorax gibbosus]|uniref:AF4/FMR2 family member lilli n=1 Tax=Oedothorax gibbosus TaxID=931172 RepID=A0AAV6W2A5_9ARAC|nr:hypothetical protein JTE90_010374 [Oedothorax gibbosus]